MAATRPTNSSIQNSGAINARLIVAKADLIRTDDFNMIDDLHNAVDVGCNLLGQLRVIERCQATLKHEHASFGFAGDASQRRVRVCSKASADNLFNGTRQPGLAFSLIRHSQNHCLSPTTSLSVLSDLTSGNQLLNRLDNPNFGRSPVPPSRIRSPPITKTAEQSSVKVLGSGTAVIGAESA